MAAPTIRNTTAASNSGGSLAVTKPAGLAVGDYLIAWHISDNDGALASMGGPSGWSLLGSSAGTTGGHPYEKVWTKVATATETGASTFTFTDSASGIHNSVVCMAITTGTYDTTTPTTAVSFNNGGTSSSTSHVAPSVTGVVDGLLLTSHGTDSGGSAGTYSPPSGMTERADTNGGSGSYTALEVCSVALTSTASTGTKTATCSLSRPWKGSSLIVNPVTALSTGVRQNLSPNPALKVDATGWSGPAGWTDATGLSATLPRTTGFTGTATGDVTAPRAAVTAGTQYYWAVWVHAVSGQAATAQVDYYTATSGGSFVSSSSTVAVNIVAGDTARVVIGPHTVPATAAAGSLKLIGLDGEAQITAHQVEKSASFWDYFDGDSAGAAWDGTNGLSTSTVRQTHDAVTVGETFSIVATIDTNAKLATDSVAVAEALSIAATAYASDAVAVTDGFLIMSLEWDPDYGRNRISAFTFQPDVAQAVVSRRRVPAGGWEQVRGGTVDVVDGRMVRRVDDYEFPSGVDLDYRVQGIATPAAGGGVLQTAVTRRASVADSVWLKFITNPALNRRLEFMGRTEITRQSRTAMYDVQGRSDPVVVSDVHGSRRFSIRCKAETPAEAATLDAALSTGLPCYLQVPETINTPSVYAVIGDYTADTPALRSHRNIFTISLVEVAPPPASIVSPGATWQRVIDTYQSWEAFAAAVPTWLKTAD